MGESALTLVVVGAMFLGVELLCVSLIDALRWHMYDERPSSFFGYFTEMLNIFAVARGCSSAIGSSLLFFGIARLVALGAPGLVATTNKREPPRAAL